MQIRSSSLVLFLASVTALAILSFSVFQRSRVTQENDAQTQYLETIENHLKQRGVPVKNVTLRNGEDIEISLQSSSPDINLTMDDNWSMQLASHEAALAYRTGLGFKSFTLVLYNEPGQVIASIQSFSAPEDLNRRPPLVQPRVEIEKAKEIVSSQLSLGEMKINHMEINPDEIADSRERIMFLQVSGEDLAAVNRSLPNFLNSLTGFLDRPNLDLGVSIVLCHLQVLDGTGTVLLDYVSDAESGFIQWKITEKDLVSDWFPHPEDAAAKFTPAPVGPQWPYPSPAENPAELRPLPAEPTPSEAPGLYPAP